MKADQKGMGRARTDLARYTRRMHRLPHLRRGQDGRYPHSRIPQRSFLTWLNVPFATISVLIILGTLFFMSMERGGWSWSSWTYAFSFAIILPLALLEIKRRAVITGGAVLLLFFMVLIDAGMPGMFGYSPSDLNWYDNLAHYLGALVLTMFLWSFLWWTISPTGPPSENGRREFFIAIIVMALVSFLFEFMELFTDVLFGWTNFHPGIDTVGDLIFDFAGITTAAMVIARHRISAIRRPFWHAESSSL